MYTSTRPHICPNCDKGFSRKYDLKRHLKTVHDDKEEEESMMYDTAPSEASYMETIEEEEEEEEEADEESEEEDEHTDESMSSDLEDNSAFQDWLLEAKEATSGMREEKIQKYVDEGLTEEDANDKADRKMLWAVKRNFFARFKDYLSSNMRLKDNFTYQEVVEDLQERLDKGMDINKALRRVLLLHRSKFDALFETDEEEEEEEEDEEAEAA